MNTQIWTWHRNISFEDIHFKNTPFLESWLADIIDYLKKNNSHIVFSWDNFNIHHIRLSDFLAVFSSIEARDSYRASLLQVSSDNLWERQKPKLRWEFNYNWDYYLILGVELPFNRFDADVDSIHYKNIILNPKEFLKSMPSIQTWVITDTKTILLWGNTD